MRILHVNTTAHGGGAAQLAFDLMEGCNTAGHSAWLAVREKTLDDERLLAIRNEAHRHQWARLCNRVVRPLAGNRLARACGRPWSTARVLLGHEDFDFPGSHHLLEHAPDKPDVLHLHNLHGSYFDLRVLPWLSRQIPTVVTLHDAWLLSGHCSHSFDCERWRTGCGTCPDLTIYPSIRRDATAYNWRRKQKIYSQSRLHIAAPCRWLMEKLNNSMLPAAVASTRIIHHGIDLSVFQPGDRAEARQDLGFPRDATILLFAAKGIRNSIAKDYPTMRKALEILSAQNPGKPLFFVALGEDGPPEEVGQAKLQFVPHLSDRRVVAKHYQAADIYVHASRAEVWGLSITEAMACGLPVVASDVGGIPDQVTDGQNGFLFPPGDSNQMAERIQRLINDNQLRSETGRRAYERAHREFGIQHMTQNYLDFYESALRQRSTLNPQPVR